MSRFEQTESIRLSAADNTALNANQLQRNFSTKLNLERCQIGLSSTALYYLTPLLSARTH